MMGGGSTYGSIYGYFSRMRLITAGTLDLDYTDLLVVDIGEARGRAHVEDPVEIIRGWCEIGHVF